MKCADVQIIDIVIRTMEVEQVNQVGSFVWSHLTNLNETSDRHKQGLRDLLATINIGDKFNLDKRKFSHHFEKSFFLQQYNIGSSFESNIVWSPSSFVPKSLSANLTVDLFGRSVNLLDIGGRFEGIEAFLESYFGPNGYFSDVGDYGISRHIEQSAQFQKLMDIRSKLPRATDPKGTFYARIFGQERGYARFDGQNSLFGDNFNILELLISMTNNQEYKKTQNVQFLDSSLTVPTCAGLPISLSVDGTVTIDLKASGRMDLRKLITSPRSVLIDGAIEPSASVEISGLMSLDASVTKSGIKVLSNVHTSTLLKGKIEYTEGRNVKLEVDIPRDKMEIVSFKTAIFHNANGRDYEQPTTESRQHSHRFCTGDMVEQLSGLQLCGEIEVPVPEHPTGAPYMSLTGPVQANVQLLKTDNMTGYKFESRFVKTKQAITVHIEVDTPGSDTDRRIGASFAMDNLDPSISLNIFSPWKKVLFNGVFENSRTLRRVFGKLSVDSSHDFSINAELLRSRRGHSIVYTPNLDIRLPLQERIRLEGTIVYLPFKTIDLDIMLNGVQTSPIMTKVTLHNKSMIRSILGSISFEPGKDYRASAGIHRLWSNRAVKYRPYMSIQTPQKEILVFDGSTEYKPGRTVTIGIRLRKAFKENISVFCRIRKIASKRNKRYETKLDVGSGYVNTRIHSSVVIRGKKAFLSRSSVDYVIPEVMREKITINGKGNIVQSKYLTVATSTL
ncbi:apolipophorins-like [Argopecten irradians]|uniref:apolipophorins-like n=1 Tax=Argopecten irradians TaxID=31199 RepID=UPI003710C2F9